MHLWFGPVLTGLVEWFLGTHVSQPGRILTGVETARALAALAGILLLGLGAIFVIGLSGRWMRRWVYPKKTESTGDWVSPESKMGKLDWGKQPLKDSEDQPQLVEDDQ